MAIRCLEFVIELHIKYKIFSKNNCNIIINNTNNLQYNQNELFQQLILFLLSKWDENEINRNQLEYINNLCHHFFEK